MKPDVSPREINEHAQALVDAVKEKLFGMDEVIRLTLVAFYTKGHVLLEGNPGFGKTELVKRLGDVLHLPFKRIQFTPDLIPADITGTYIPDQTNRNQLVFRKGPIFTSLLLADEINRATPKTQSAMLEAMAELQVTVLGEKRELQPPFMVLATQNPIDHEGTYNLPEAQADRFMFKITMPIPDDKILRRIVSKETGASSENGSNDEGIETPADMPGREKKSKKNDFPFSDEQASRRAHAAIHTHIQEMKPVHQLEVHISNMFLASNRRYGDMKDCSANQVKWVERLVNELMTYGLGPRAAIGLMNGAKAWALLFSPEGLVDDTALARVVIPVLRHRIKLDLDWEERYNEIPRKHLPTWPDAGDIHLLERMLADFCCATAPRAKNYNNTIKQALKKVFEEYWRAKGSRPWPPTL